jgi:enhancer of mRNA-decapping protein 4
VNLLVDPTKELSILVSQHKYEEAFSIAMHQCDASLVNWLCFKVKLSILYYVSY